MTLKLTIFIFFLVSLYAIPTGAENIDIQALAQEIGITDRNVRDKIEDMLDLQQDVDWDVIRRNYLQSGELSILKSTLDEFSHSMNSTLNKLKHETGIGDHPGSLYEKRFGHFDIQTHHPPVSEKVQIELPHHIIPKVKPMKIIILVFVTLFLLVIVIKLFGMLFSSSILHNTNRWG